MVKDRDSQQALRILFDRIFDLESLVLDAQSALSAAQATIDEQTASLTALRKKVTLIEAPAGTIQPTPMPEGGSVEPGGSEGGVPGDVDDGQGAQGCSQAGSNGHVDATLPRNMVTAGMIICGTAVEWAVLMDPAPDETTREAEAEQMLGRMIWHLNTQGYIAGRQRNPSGLISKDKLTVQIDGVFRAYDVLSLNPAPDYMTSHCIQVFPADYVVDGGIPD
jgi:hypothetical protein